MSSLAQDRAPGLHPGARPFENMPDDLSLVGVQYAVEQLDLLERGSVFRPNYYERLYVMVVQPLADPVFPESEALGLLALTLDEHLNADPVLVPAVAEVDCSQWEFFDQSEPHWRRFPSLLVRKHLLSPWSGEWEVHGADVVRLWDTWPLHGIGAAHLDAALVNHAVQDWRAEHWGPYLRWLEVRDNADTEPCDYEGTPEHLHDHGPDADGRHRSCRTADVWFEHYRATRMTTDPDGDPYPRPFPAVGGLAHLGPVWEHLLASSRANTHAALSGYPPWEQDEVARTERHYSPWLWSC